MTALLTLPAGHGKTCTNCGGALNPIDGLVDTVHKPVGSHIPAVRPYSVGLVLLASIAGMAICAVWIAFTWRAWG